MVVWKENLAQFDKKRQINAKIFIWAMVHLPTNFNKNLNKGEEEGEDVYTKGRRGEVMYIQRGSDVYTKGKEGEVMYIQKGEGEVMYIQKGEGK